LLDHGYKAEKVAVVPLGVDIAAFTPLLGVERTLRRAQMGLDPDETVFANAGGPLWNAGIDLLLRAFAALCRRGRRVRLMLADQHQPTGMSVDEMVHRVGADYPDLLRPETLAAICVIRGALERLIVRKGLTRRSWKRSPAARGLLSRGAAPPMNSATTTSLVLSLDGRRLP
jgi:hypothetical protein